MTSPENRGAAILARARTPAIDLALLAELLAKAIPAGGSDTVRDLPLFRYDAEKKRLHVCLGGAQRRLVATASFADSFVPGDNTGFIRDIELPPRGTTAKVGGRLLVGSESKTTSAIDKLYAAVAQALDAVLPAGELPQLAGISARDFIARLEKQLATRLPRDSGSATMVPIGFASPDRPYAEREKDLARVLSASEMIEAGDWLEKMLAGVERVLEEEELPRSEVADILDALRQKQKAPGSDVRRFLDFLDEEALARVRLLVAFKLMEAVAAQSDSEHFKRYVSQVVACQQHFSGAKAESLLLDPSSVYGQRNVTDLGDHLRKALAYDALPVWPEWSVQMFEVRRESAAGFATEREVSYRFRVNGMNPQTGTSAFAARIARLEAHLLEAPGPYAGFPRAFAELVFLHLAVPHLSAPAALDIRAEAERIAAALKADPVATVRGLIDDLRSREKAMDAIGDELIRVLQSRSKRIVETANRTADRFYITVQRNVVDWAALVSMTSVKANVLRRNERGDDKIVWFNNLVVSDNPAAVAGLASYWVETRLEERAIAPAGSPVELRMMRDLDGAVLPVRFVPFQGKGTPWQPVGVKHQGFQSSGVDVEYDMDLISQRRGDDSQPDEKVKFEQRRAASCAGFALLVYVALWELVRRLKQLEKPPASVFLLRLQPRGRDAKDTDGNQALYAISHALERALCRELPVKMQGFLTEGANEDWRKRGALVALQAGSPVHTRRSGGLDNVAIVSYVTRPCDTHPLYTDSDGFLFVSRTYRADREGDGFRLYLDSMQSRLVDSRKSFREPQLVLEEIARLEKAGYRHIILLSHHFGNRHIGRAAERHAPHSTFEFLEEAATKFPQVVLYPLRRDVFPATRLHKRKASESAFEVLDFSAHKAMFDAAKADMLRSLIPVYTFATLAVVEEAHHPQSGFCTYFLDVEERLSQWSELARHNILGIGTSTAARDSLVGVLRAMHYLESEKCSAKVQMLPVLDPFDWATPSGSGAAGELTVMQRRQKGSVELSFAAILAHVTKVLHKEAQ